MKYEVIIAFTSRGLSGQYGMAVHGGSGHWTATPKNLSKATYLICVRNRRRDHEEWAEEDLPHGQAFVLAKVTGVTEAPRRNPDQKQRYIVLFEEYTEIDVPDAWRKCTGGQHFPVAYRSRDDVEAALGLDFDDPSFEWKRLSDLQASQADHSDDAEDTSTSSRPLTVEQAKQGLAAHFGVNPEQIDIHVSF